MSILKPLRSVGQKSEAGSCCGAEPGDEARSVTQPAPGAAFRRALAAKCQGCLSRRLPPCPFLPYHPAGRLRAGRKPSPAFLALLPEVSGAGLSPRGALLGALLGASLALALGETSPSLSGSPQGRCWPAEPCWAAHLWVPRAGRCRPVPLRFALRERNVAPAHLNFSWQLPGGGYGCRVPWPKHRELAGAAEAKQQTMNLGGIPVPIPAVGTRGDAPGRAPSCSPPSLPSHYRSSRDLSKLWPAGEVPAAARRPRTALAGASLEGHPEQKPPRPEDSLSQGIFSWRNRRAEKEPAGPWVGGGRLWAFCGSARIVPRWRGRRGGASAIQSPAPRHGSCRLRAKGKSPGTAAGVCPRSRDQKELGGRPLSFSVPRCWKAKGKAVVWGEREAMPPQDAEPG
ncbi:hypothetical protein LUU34_01471600 [Aix galericulata]|nr:hypothetical protein LUU34_01471600 [Aix galericulata]